MPSRPDSSAAPTLRDHTSRLARIIGLTLVTAVAIFCAFLLAVRFVLYPQIESHRLDVAAMLSREIGASVEIDAIQTGWYGWNPELIVRGFRIRERDGQEAVLEVPEITGIVSWTSLMFADVRLHQLVIERPQLAVRRDATGKLHVAGLRFDATQEKSGGRSTDWLLRQRLIVVRDAKFAWKDELRNAPPLHLTGVDFRLENRFGRHSFGLRGTPPAPIATPIEVRGDLASATFADWRKAAGRLYLRLDFADVAALSRWLPLPADVESAQGAMRLWFDFDEGIASDVVADLELVSVRARLAAELPPLDVAHLSGRVTWRQQGTSRALAARGLELIDHGGASIAPTDLDLRYEVAAGGSTASGRITSSALELVPLVKLAAHLPLPAQVRERLAQHAPQGTLRDGEYAWEGPFAAPTTFRARGAFAALGTQPVEAFPGFAGWSGRFDATQAGGTIDLTTRGASLTMPRVFTEPLAFDSADGRVKWTRSGGRTSIRIDDLRYSNAHVAGTAQGTWRSTARGPGEVDVTARITRADGKNLYRYLPTVVGDDTRLWLRDSLRSGSADDARLVLKGDLAGFPFVEGKGGTFVVTVNARDASLDYANGWPPLAAVDAQLRFEGQSLSVTASRGSVLGASLGRTKATIADLSLAIPVVAIDGEATGPTSEFLQFIRSSPVAAWMDHYTDDVSATGNGRLGLKFELALGHADAPPAVVGEYQLIDNALRLPGAPSLSAVNGRLDFTERQVEGRDIAVETLGGPARISLVSEAGGLKVKASGRATTAAVAREVDAAVAERFSGDADWQLALDARKGFASWTIESSLRGVAIDLPRPIAKTAAESVPLKVERRALDKDATRDAIIVDYGTTARVVAHRTLGAAGASTDRMLVLLGKATQQASAAPDRAGITIQGDVGAVNADEWLALAGAQGTAAATAKSSTLDLEAIDVTAGDFVALGRSFDAMSLSARRSAQRWRLKFASRQVEGTAEWEPAGSKLANGRFSAQLAKLDYIAMRDAGVAQPRSEAPRREGSANPWPELDIKADRFIARAGNLGRMELVARPEGSDWRVSRFALINDAGRIDADGTWRMIGLRQQTRFDVNVTTSNTSAFLTHLGFPGDVKDASAELAGRIEWPGSPTDFEYHLLAGNFHIDVGAGQFTKMDPGVGKLLGVLSLQALPRRIALDFRDVFSEGFAFDTIAGNVRIANGVLHTDDLLVSGPAAKVVLAGDVDLSKETQQLSVRVQPSLSSVVSTGAGAAAVVLLAANPLVGAAVGAGALLAQKIMQDPIEQIFSYEYAVRGSWSDPVVERLARVPMRLGTGDAPKTVAGDK